MNISNETKIGALTSVAIVLLILGFNFLKGKTFGGKTTQYYAVFSNIQGLANSNPVIINGKQVGTISGTDGGRDMRRIVVAMNMSQAVDIPANSVASINPSLVGTTSLEIKLGDSSAYYKDGDTLISVASGGGMFDEAFKKVDPVLKEVKGTVVALDSVLTALHSMLDVTTKNNIKGTMENLNKMTASLVVSSASLQSLLNAQTGAVAKTMDNLSSFTGTLAKNNNKLEETMTNLDKTTENFSKLDLQKTLTTIDGTLTGLKDAVGKINSEDGSLGKLINNASLYNNLNATSNKINLLLDDIRVHPKRYVSISVFGKKDKDEPLTVPTPDTVNAPYKINKTP
jgi:phospholipid/cholesterol/gamma-HCH transport system substrate-binding protein